MLINSLSRACLSIDRGADYIPIVSTVTNLVDIFQKVVVLPFKQKENISKNVYYTHLDQKSFRRCLILLVPVLGNILVGIYDVVRNKEKKALLANVQKNGLALKDGSDTLKSDRDVVLAAVQENGLALKYASKQLQNDKKVVLAAIQENGTALKYASKQLRNDNETVLAAIQENGSALKYASKQLRNDKEVVLAAVQRSHLALKYASKQLRNAREVVLAADNRKWLGTYRLYQQA
ncbi:MULTISPECIES: DUF4116 domain-containing protein [unclassified Neochlamydia]|uniref:DUF4116 domain-containing protein n=1 Tax=unclassified Neochlamydia TaxID=2643326 RepID=UPI00140CD7ED|nr:MULTISPECIES: DUF4116 domain-containing protein [unclassified Neochlamydia]NGY95796.1 hypothetical protein [Neochlamydia sp. AcF84]